MTDLFKSKDTMPPVKEVISVSMDRTETLLENGSVPILSGQRQWLHRNVEHVIRPRRGHDY